MLRIAVFYKEFNQMNYLARTSRRAQIYVIFPSQLFTTKKLDLKAPF